MPERSVAWHVKHRWLLWRYQYARWRQRHDGPRVLDGE